MKAQYAQLLDGMMDAILAGDAKPAAMLLRDKAEFPPAAQLGIYIDGYRWRLADTVEAAYPALAHYLGKPAFSGLAKGFIAAHPSRHFNLDRYAIAFADYVAGHSDDSAARELAALEGTIHGVYQGEETPALDAGWAQRQTLETLAGTQLQPRAASRLLVLDYAVDAYVAAFRAGENPANPAARQNWLLVLRHRHQVNRLALMEGEYALLALLGEGLTLAQALEDARLAPHAEREEFAASLGGWLSRWIAEGVFRQPA